MLKELFDIEKIYKLFSYNWSDVFKYIMPTKNKVIESDNEYKSFYYGSILTGLGLLLYIIISTLVNIIIASNSFYTRLEYGPNAFFSLLGNAIPSMIIQIFLSLILSGGVYYYSNRFKEKQQVPIVYFILAIISVLGLIGTVLSLLDWLIKLFSVFIGSIFGIASSLLLIMGFVHYLVGAIDICTRANSGLEIDKEEIKIDNP